MLISGASSGIGAATAEAFGAAGAKLLLGARRTERLERTAEAARRAGSPLVLTHGLDVTNTESVAAFTRWARDETPTVDVLINNAGGAHGLDAVAAGEEQDWAAIVETNLLGLLRVTRAVLPMLPRDAGAAIVNVGSIAALQAYAGGSAYCAAKAGALQISRALRLELNGTGIRVGTVHPGLVETEFSLVRFKGDAERARKVYEGLQPLTAADVAESIVWMASRPPHVCVDELLLLPVAQATVSQVHRRPGPEP